MRVRERSARAASSSLTAERELMLLLMGTAARRRRRQSRIEELARGVDFESLASLLGRQGLLPLGLARLLETVPGSVPDDVLQRLAAVTAPATRRGLVLEALALQFQADLEQAGVAAIPLKGPLLSRYLYGDPGVRSAVDLDFLVAPRQLESAVQTISARGYSLQRDPFETNGLPLLHHHLSHDNGRLVPVELHWRVHWYEAQFSADMLARSRMTPDGPRARPEDEFASLLLFYARDGFVGLRLAADIATWWDRHDHRADSPLLDAHVAAYPGLRGALDVTTRLLEGLIGLPRRSLLSAAGSSSWRQRTATRLANWEGTGILDQVSANVSFVDGLLTPRGGVRRFVRRALIPPSAKIERMYGLRGSALWKRLWWRFAHGPKLVLRYLIALWRIRRGRHWGVPLPKTSGDRSPPDSAELNGGEQVQTARVQSLV